MPLTSVLQNPRDVNALSIVNSRKMNPEEVASNTIRKYRETGNASIYITAFNKLQSPESTSREKLAWLSQMTECVTLLDRKADKIVIEFLKIPWYKYEEVTPAVNSFIATLVTAYNYYTYLVLKQLFTFLIPEVDESQDEALTVAPCAMSKQDEAYYLRVVNAIVDIHNLVPLCRDNLMVLARKCMPYYRRHVHQHAVYTFNLLLLTSRLPHLRLHFLEIIISNMVTIDVNTPRADLMIDDDSEDELDDEDCGDTQEEMFEMEVDESGDQPEKEVLNFTKDPPLATRHKEGNTLDVLMTIMLQYIHDVCHGITEPRIPKEISQERLSSTFTAMMESANDCEVGRVHTSDTEDRTLGCDCKGEKHNLDALKLLYLDLREVFSHLVLCTQASSHVQFLMFYIISIRPGLITSFLEYLKKKFEDPNCPRDVRRNAMAYIGSLVARAKCIPFSHIHSCLELICSWCHSYLENQDDVTNYEDLLLHFPFYYACQTVFYIFTFRYKDYTESPKKLDLARDLNMERLVHSQLNPLKVCAAPIVSNFATVTRRFQLLYCFTIIENNKRMGIPTTRVDGRIVGASTLDMFFPFDPYLLERSRRYISCHFKEFDGLPEDESEAKEFMDQDDGGLDTIISPKSSEDARSDRFSYGSSPGFKNW